MMILITAGFLLCVLLFLLFCCFVFFAVLLCGCVVVWLFGCLIRQSWFFGSVVFGSSILWLSCVLVLVWLIGCLVVWVVGLVCSSLSW